MRRELILNFHGVGTPRHDIGPQERAVWISRESFGGLLDETAQLRAVEEIPIGITFDDGNLSDVTIALPELSKRGLAATFFVCAGRLDTPGYLSRRGVRDLCDAGMKIGSHGMHHRDWRHLDEATLADEIGSARKRLEDVCGEPVVAAAIPFGSYDRRVLTRLRAERFACVYTSDGGFARPDAWMKPRNTLTSNSTQNDILRLIRLVYSPQSAFQRAIRLYKMLR